MLSLDYLDRVFPDARFVMTHRDPTDVILSVADVYADIVGGFTDHLDRRYLGELNVSHWSLGMDRAVKFRDGGADHRFFDIDFRAMQADPIGEVRRLYAWLGEPVSDEFEARHARDGGRRTPKSANRTRMPTRRRSGSTWRRSGRCSPPTSTIRNAGSPAPKEK